MADLEFVLAHVINPEFKDQVLLILKDRPAALAGRFNLPGGKIEPGETPVQAALRELEEETGYKEIEEAECLGILQTERFKVHCVRVCAADQGPPQPRASETEQAVWMPWEQFVDDGRVIPNLKVIVPMMQLGVTGFTVFQKPEKLEIVFE
jgi:8-oxo-dGTP diphosphatase